MRPRPAVLEDFEPWFALFSEVAAEGRYLGSEAPLDRDARYRSFLETLEAGDATTIVVDDNGALIAAGGVHITRGIAGFGMFVAGSHRGRGVGRALIDAVIAWSRDHGAHKLSLQVWPHNGGAIVLYRRAGFAIEGRLVREYRRASGELWDALVMGMVLDTSSPGSPLPDAL